VCTDGLFGFFRGYEALVLWLSVGVRVQLFISIVIFVCIESFESV
jgi:hypothetical protein